jgi:hypothetical protein
VGRSTRGFCSCTTVPRLTGHLQPRINWPTWASNVFVTHPILRIWSRRTTTCFLDWKTTEMLPFSVRHGGHCCRRYLVGRTTFWFFFKALKSWSNGLKNVLSFVGRMLYKSRVMSLLFVSFLVGLGTYQHLLLR